MDYEPDDFEEYNRNEADDYRNEGDALDAPTCDPSDCTLVFVWNNETNRFERKPAYQVVCDQCQEQMFGAGWEWEFPRGDYPYLVCACGQQFYQTEGN